MTVNTTRLLVLGVVQTFEPANGYQLRRELLSWEVESWAHVNPGSIYSMLSTLSRQSLLERTEVTTAGSSRSVTVYRMTAEGRRELVALIREAATTIEPFDRAPFYAALSLAPPMLSRADVLELLELRLENLIASTGELNRRGEQLANVKASPPHVIALFGYAPAVAEGERTWLERFIRSIRSGEMLFSDDDWSVWTAPADDPGWDMVAQREAYLAQLD